MIDLEAPYWTIPSFDGLVIVPVSGEVIPIDVPPVPVDVPVAGPVLHFIGEGEHAVWNDVWGWIKGASKSFADEIVTVEQQIGTAVVNVVEGYVGNELKAFSGFINRAFDYANTGLDAINFWTADALSTVFGDVQGITQGLVDLENIVNAIETHVIPGIFADLLGQIEGVYADLVGGIDLVKTWAIDNIRTPLDAEIRGVEAAIPVWAEGALTDAKAYADQLVHSEAVQRAAAIAGIAASVAAITTWIDDCGEPMCQVQGPKTDLGKLFKALQLAADAALLAELASMNETELIALIQSIAARTGAAIDFVNAEFVLHGKSIGSTIADAIGANL